MSRLYPRTFSALKEQGWPAAKATDLLLAARRGDGFSLLWVRVAARLKRDARNRMQAAVRTLCAHEELAL